MSTPLKSPRRTGILLNGPEDIARKGLAQVGRGNVIPVVTRHGQEGQELASEMERHDNLCNNKTGPGISYKSLVLDLVRELSFWIKSATISLILAPSAGYVSQKKMSRRWKAM